MKPHDEPDFHTLMAEHTKSWPWWATRTMQSFGRYLMNTEDEEEAFMNFTACYHAISITDNRIYLEAIEVDSIIIIQKYGMFEAITNFHDDGITYYVNVGGYIPFGHHSD